MPTSESIEIFIYGGTVIMYGLLVRPVVESDHMNQTKNIHNGDPAPGFTLPDQSGDMVSLSDFILSRKNMLKKH